MHPATSAIPRIAQTLSPLPLRGPQCRRFTSDSIIQENDVILIRQRGARKSMWRLTPPLRSVAKGHGPAAVEVDEGSTDESKPSGLAAVDSADTDSSSTSLKPAPTPKVKLHHGATVDMTSLIGRRYMDRLKDSSGRDITLYEASMANYVVHVDKKAVPIYPHDASTIVSMLDLHPDRPGETTTPSQPFEVFEAGTGAGSLTLHIARALHAGNAALSPRLREAIFTAGVSSSHSESGIQSANIANLHYPSPELKAEAEEYVKGRGAVLHTLDRKAAHSFLAHQSVRRFRRAMYLPNIDFHVGSIREYLSSRIAENGGRPFLSRAVLDLAAPEDHALPVIQALLPNAILVVFSPSISQIAAFAAWKTKTGQPLRMDRVAELQSSTSAEYGVMENEGGRTWDLRTVNVGEDGGKGSATDGMRVEGDGEGLVQVMRPRAGDRIAGGGFVGVFRKMKDVTEAEREGKDERDEALEL